MMRLLGLDYLLSESDFKLLHVILNIQNGPHFVNTTIRESMLRILF